MNDSQNPYQAPMTTTTAAAFDGERTINWLLFGFKGRVPRRNFWAVSLVTTGIFYAVVLLLTTNVPKDSALPGIIILLLDIPLVWISLAIQIKRWHDRDKSGWWFLINFIPIIGGLWAFVELGCLRGSIGPNQYGQDPT
jgi:uncharacterized membrane protein YhaH (DUF805 family)